MILKIMNIANIQISGVFRILIAFVIIISCFYSMNNQIANATYQRYARNEYAEIEYPLGPEFYNYIIVLLKISIAWFDKP